MKSQRERDAEWAYEMRLRIDAKKAGQVQVPWFERNSAVPAAVGGDPELGEESQDPGGWEAA